MIKYRESKICAHHNYLVNNILTPGFLAGDPHSPNSFYFLADFVPPGDISPRIFARFFGQQGGLLLELKGNQIEQNPSECTSQSFPGGYKIIDSSGDPLLEVHTQSFANGHLTRIKARLVDDQGNLRIEPLGESIQVHEEADLVLDAPYRF